MCSIVEIIFREVVTKLKMQLQKIKNNMLHNKSTIKSKWCEVKEYNDRLASWHA